MDSAGSKQARPRLSERSAWRLGLVAVALMMAGAGWYQAWSVPPYFNADEQAHAGYVLTLLDGHLPTVDQPIPADEGGWLLDLRVEGTRERYGDVWVANNPPLGYLAYLPPSVATRVIGSDTAPLMALRLVNVAFFAIAAVMLAQLGRRLSGGDDRVGLIAAGIFAMLPHVGTIAGSGYLDGLALVCVLGLLSSVASIAATGASRRNVVTASLWCTLAAGVRPMSATLAVASVAAIVSLMGYRWATSRRASPNPAPSSRRVSPSPVSIPWAAVVLLVPMTVVNGWFYVRNIVRYGGPTGSSRLAEKFGLVAGRTVGDVLHEGPWAQPVRTLLNRRYTNAVPGPPLWLWSVTRWALVLAVAATAAIVVTDQLKARRARTEPRTPASAWALMAAFAALTAVLAAVHWVDGGRIHPRYLFPALVVALIAMALPLVRAGVWWLGIVLVIGVALLQVHETPSLDYYRSLFENPVTPLAELPGPAWVPAVGIGLVLIGLAGLCASAFGLDPRRSHEDRTSAIGDAPAPS